MWKWNSMEKQLKLFGCLTRRFAYSHCFEKAQWRTWSSCLMFFKWGLWSIHCLRFARLDSICDFYQSSTILYFQTDISTDGSGFRSNSMARYENEPFLQSLQSRWQLHLSMPPCSKCLVRSVSPVFINKYIYYAQFLLWKGLCSDSPL